MNILNSRDELKQILNEAEQDAYLTTAWFEQTADMAIDQSNMKLISPATGILSIRAGYKLGCDHYVIKFLSSLQQSYVNDDVVHRRVTLVGCAQTGIAKSLLIESYQGCIQNNYYQVEAPDIKTLKWLEIQSYLGAASSETVYEMQKEGFKAFSKGDVIIPSVIYLPFEGRGDLHLKGAHQQGSSHYVFKIATAFGKNKERGLLPSQGVMMAFDAKSAMPTLILVDEGHLTDLRTAIAGRNAAQQLMPEHAIKGIGMLGTGVQARLQLAQLESLYPNCRELTVWGRTPQNVQNYAVEIRDRGWQVTIANEPREVAQNANLIVTTTASDKPILTEQDIAFDNTLIIAIGADMPNKVELSSTLLKNADVILIDSIEQGKDHGNAAEPIKSGLLSEDKLQEFGDYLNNGLKEPNSEKGLKLFLSSGVGVQDLKIVQAVINTMDIQ